MAGRLRLFVLFKTTLSYIDQKSSMVTSLPLFRSALIILAALRIEGLKASPLHIRLIVDLFTPLSLDNSSCVIPFRSNHLPNRDLGLPNPNIYNQLLLLIAWSKVSFFKR